MLAFHTYVILHQLSPSEVVQSHAVRYAAAFLANYLRERSFLTAEAQMKKK